MKGILQFIQGKKTYLVVAASVVLGTLSGLDIFVVPDEIWAVLAALGLGSLRSAAKKIEAGIKEAKE